ncbi:MAG: flagellar hook-associated protein FlgK [Ignavibacteriales bacterium]
MGSSFFGLNVAMTGLYTSQRALDITNHNITNTNTPGYSRQVISQKAETPTATSDGTGMMGNGTQITGTERIRDSYLDFKYWSENVSLGEWTTKETMLSDIEAVFNEPSDSGFNTVLNEFYSAIEELEKDPSSLATRALVREKGITLTNYFNSTAASLEKIQSDINYSIKSKVDEINSISTQICALNEQIYKYELQGDTAGDLRDERGVLVDKLSKLANISAQEVVIGKHENGADNVSFQIIIDGKYLVNNLKSYKITYSQDDVKNNPEDIPGLYNLYWEDGTEFDPGGGELKGYLDVRDGAGDTNNSFKGVPYYLRQMNQFVRTFARSFNEGYADYNSNGSIETEDLDGDGVLDAGEDTDTDGVLDIGENKIGFADGYGLDNIAGDLRPGTRFFTINEQDSATFVGAATLPNAISALYNNMTAGNFSLSQDVIDDLANILTTTTAGEISNSDVLLSITDFRHDASLFDEGTPEDFMSSIISNLGIDTQEAGRVGSNQATIVKQIDNRRSSNSGVSLDEEMSNMVKFQHAYNASAKMITTLSEIYDMLINRMGSF